MDDREHAKHQHAQLQRPGDERQSHGGPPEQEVGIASAEDDPGPDRAFTVTSAVGLGAQAEGAVGEAGLVYDLTANVGAVTVR